MMATESQKTKSHDSWLSLLIRLPSFFREWRCLWFPLFPVLFWLWSGSEFMLYSSLQIFPKFLKLCFIQVQTFMLKVWSSAVIFWTPRFRCQSCFVRVLLSLCFPLRSSMIILHTLSTLYGFVEIVG